MASRITTRVVFVAIAIDIVEIPDKILGYIAENVVEFALDEKILDGMAQPLFVPVRVLENSIGASESSVIRGSVPLFETQILEDLQVEHIRHVQTFYGHFEGLDAEIRGEHVLIANSDCGKQSGRLVYGPYFRGYFVVEEIIQTLHRIIDKRANACEQKSEPYDLDDPTLGFYDS